jgi:hypothetical protein
MAEKQERIATEQVPVQTTPEASSRPERLDGRRLHRTGRVLAFSTRVTYEFDEIVRQAAQRDGILMIEVLERALALYEKANKN